MSGPTGAGREEVVLAVDVGSSSVRACFYGAAGVAVGGGAAAKRPYGWSAGPAEQMELPAEELLSHVVAAIDEAVAHAREARLEIAAVAIAAFWHGLLGLDASGAPLTPVTAWGDLRATPDAARLRVEADEPDFHRRTGCFFHPSYPSVRLLWLRRRHPDVFRSVRAWVSFPEYLEERIFGTRRCSYSIASGSGLLDVHRLRWDPESLELAGISEERLSPLVDSDVPLRGPRAEFSARWPTLARVPWYPALGDGACANVGSGAVGRGQPGLTIGTSAALRALWEADRAEVPPDLWCYRLDGRRWVAGQALSNGGNGPAHLRRLLALTPGRSWEAELEAMEPDSHGLTILPFLVGERGPDWLLEREAVIAGLTQATPPEHLFRAWMEAIAYRIAAVADRLDDALGPVTQLWASGGAIYSSPAWAQILADATGRTLVVPGEREATCRGAALVAQECLGWISDLAPAPLPVLARLEPRPAHHARYRAAMERQRALAAALRPWLRPELHEDPET